MLIVVSGDFSILPKDKRNTKTTWPTQRQTSNVSRSCAQETFVNFATTIGVKYVHWASEKVLGAYISIDFVQYFIAMTKKCVYIGVGWLV